MNKEHIKDILFKVRNEFENEVDNIDDIFGDISDKELDLMFRFLDMFINKVNTIIDEESEDDENDL